MISFGLVDGHPLFMDEQTDSYFMLERSDEVHFLDLLASGRALMPDKRLRDAFGASEEGSTIIRADCPSPTRSLLDERQRERARLLGIAELALLVRSTKRLLAREPIELILSDLPRSQGPEDFGDPQAVIARGAAFAALRKFVPIASNCLLDSLSLLRWLGPARASTMLVFGAKLNPFAAHCWVQADQLLLNDRLESVARFSPVRIVGCSHATL